VSAGGDMIWNILTALLIVCGNICIFLYVQHRGWNPSMIWRLRRTA
jgi:hypothetical protein